MSDINLLPEDLRKKEEKTLKNREDFNLDEIEFTDGEKLKKELGISRKKFAKNQLGKWLKPKIEKKPKVEKNYNKALNTNFFSKIKDEQENIKKKIKILESSKNISEINVEKSEKLEDDNLKTIIKAKDRAKEFKLKKVNKKKRNNSSFKNLFSKFSQKIEKKKNKVNKKEKGFDVNLLPFGSNVPTTRRTISILIITFIVSSSLIFIVYFGYFIYKNKIVKDYTSLGNELDLYVEEIKKYDNLMQETSSWQEKIIKIEHLLNKHIYWTKFFEKIEENTLPNVQFIGFAGSIDTSIVLKALAPNYNTVSKQWMRLEESKDFIKKVEINGAQMVTSEDNINVSFSLTLDFVEGVFYNE